MSQYFENDKTLASQKTNIQYTYHGKLLTYTVDLGVFSKSRVDFGTNTLLQALAVKPIGKVLDVGCGYGAIGLAIAKTNPSLNVDLIDVNERALQLAIDNSKANKIYNANIFLSNCYENVKDSYDFIISNPPIRAGKKVVYEIVLGAIEHLNDGGEVVVVIQKKHGALTLMKAMEEVYSKVEVLDKESGYYVLSGKK